MQLGLTISILIHVGLLAWAYLAMASTAELKPPEPEPIAVALITPSELLALKKGSETATQLEAKAKTLLRIFSGEVEIVHSPKPFGYRGRALMRFRPGTAGGRLGFFGRRGRKLVDVRVCPVLDPSLEAVLPYLRDGMLDDVGRAVDVRLVAGLEGPLASVEAEGLLPREFYEGAAGVVPGVLAGVQAVTDGVTASVAGEALATVEGSDEGRLLVPIGGFAQANAGINRLLGRTLRQWVAEGGFASAIELFAGAGNLTVAYAGSIREVVAVEVSSSACEVMRVNLIERGLHNVKVELGDALARYRDSGRGAELVVLDPPRSGARELCRVIAQGGHRGVIYVSCDPATLGRDLGELKNGGFELVETRGFDMFPQTAHVETAVWLERV